MAPSLKTNLNSQQIERWIRILKGEFKNQSRSIQIRTTLLGTLALLGNIQLGKRILKTHLDKGGLIPYIEVSLEGIWVSNLSDQEKEKWFKTVCTESDDLKSRVKACIYVIRLDPQQKKWLEPTYEYRSQQELILLQKTLFTHFPTLFSPPINHSLPFDSLTLDPQIVDPVVPPIDQDD